MDKEKLMAQYGEAVLQHKILTNRIAQLEQAILQENQKKKDETGNRDSSPKK